MRSLPMAIAAADPRVIRPRDVREVYRQPWQELRDLTDQGALLHLAHGYYAVVPEEQRHLGGWTPPVEAVALAIAQRDYGHESVALMGMTAARALGVVPRAAGTAIVAIPKQRPALATTVGTVVFVTRNVAGLGVQQTRTELAVGWTTDPEQTLLDLVDRPELGGFAAPDIEEAIAALLSRADPDIVMQLGAAQRKRTAAERIATRMHA